jgi:hypothetical protein
MMKTVPPKEDLSFGPNHRNIYSRVGGLWIEEFSNSQAANTWLSQNSQSSPALVRKLIHELKARSATSLELLENRLADLRIKVAENTPLPQHGEMLPFGCMGKMQELYALNAKLTGLSEELIAQLRGVQDNRTASLVARLRNIQLERHQLYQRFFQPGHIQHSVRLSSRPSHF